MHPHTSETAVYLEGEVEQSYVVCLPLRYCYVWVILWLSVSPFLSHISAQFGHKTVKMLQAQDPNDCPIQSQRGSVTL